jgi:hypothetical protein
MSVDFIQIDGPFSTVGVGETASVKRIFVCRPTRQTEERACAHRILSTLAHRAYRRPVTPRDVGTLMQFYARGREEGSFEAGIRFALERLLMSPDFLIRTERDPASVSAGGAYRLSDVELASRLSFFLWSSIPDDELLGVAEKGVLHNPGILSTQVRRMIADPRSKALIENFAGQWLLLRNLSNGAVIAPDSDVFPEFDDNLRAAFVEETERFLDSQLHEDRSVVDLLTADYTFVNERLAQHYGIAGVYGSHFRRVKLTDPARFGLFGQGSILTVTSLSTRTSPVYRGKFLLENILGTPPPPPPPNVPALEEVGATSKAPKSVRERLELHRRNAVCAGCHRQMDPLGFALENFNGIGRWRTRDGVADVDTTGTLPDGTKFNGPVEFRAALLRRPEAFVTTVTEKLLSYAIGRGLEPRHDMPVLRKILRETRASDYRWSAVILSIVESAPFQQRRSAGDRE